MVVKLTDEQRGETRRRAVADGKLPEHILEARLGQIKTWAKGNGIKNLMANGLVITEFERFQGREAKGEI